MLSQSTIDFFTGNTDLDIPQIIKRNVARFHPYPGELEEESSLFAPVEKNTSYLILRGAYTILRRYFQISIDEVLNHTPSWDNLCFKIIYEVSHQLGVNIPCYTIYAKKGHIPETPLNFEFFARDLNVQFINKYYHTSLKQASDQNETEAQLYPEELQKIILDKIGPIPWTDFSIRFCLKQEASQHYKVNPHIQITKTLDVYSYLPKDLINKVKNILDTENERYGYGYKKSEEELTL